MVVEVARADAMDRQMLASNQYPYRSPITAAAD